MHRNSLWILILFCLVHVAGAEETDQRLRFILEEAGGLELLVTQNEVATPAKLVETPLLRYTNPLYKAQSSGALLIWVVDEIPVAIGSFSIRNDKQLFLEMSTLSPYEMRATKKGEVIWQPPVSELAHRDLPDAPKVPNNERFRLTVMKRLAERFSAGETRLLPTPMYRYKSPERGVIDGAVFSFVVTTDPEFLVVLDAFQANEVEEPIWRYSIGRMNSQQFDVKLDNTTLCTYTKFWKAPSRTQTYLERMFAEVPQEATATTE